MTGVLIEVPPRVRTPAGRNPGLVVAGQVGRRAGRSGVLWGAIFGFYVMVQTLAYTSAYKTQASRDRLATAFGTNVGVNALIGPARAINTVAGYASWRALGILSLLGAIWGLAPLHPPPAGRGGGGSIRVAGGRPDDPPARRRPGDSGPGLWSRHALRADRHRDGAHRSGVVGRLQSRACACTSPSP